MNDWRRRAGTEGLSMNIFDETTLRNTPLRVGYAGCGAGARAAPSPTPRTAEAQRPARASRGEPPEEQTPLSARLGWCTGTSESGCSPGKWLPSLRPLT
jgi:hypothetical protein